MPSYAITGAARGLVYFEFVNQLSTDSGNTVFALVRNEATANKLKELGRHNVHIIEADITDNKALKYAAAEVSRLGGNSLDYLINNAGSSEELLTKDLLDSNGKAKKVVTVTSGLGDLDMTIAAELVTSWTIPPSRKPRAPTEKELEQFKAMVEKFRKVYPDFTGPITPEASVRMQLEVINRITVNDTGAFISHKGNKEWL
ncbi:uncharacterized protein BJ212DRAFT_1447878 [Suillus subaureus]|uniref:NAD(P)-binding protein n=1 Tax=Suillus subaureus TaxID=48587 RepID=A0A9P7E720_9AGAM|nr:uncharacterized protein BJ212DRAFT_1447878 [Suillus subaureus]KAG1813166.1 hypothetical protein BJ212DRAFT_1447878 [Suillus subaureus]